jgi:hypothetical protein
MKSLKENVHRYSKSDKTLRVVYMIRARNVNIKSHKRYFLYHNNYIILINYCEMFKNDSRLSCSSLRCLYAIHNVTKYYSINNLTIHLQRKPTIIISIISVGRNVKNNNFKENFCLSIRNKITLKICGQH